MCVQLSRTLALCFDGFCRELLSFSSKQTANELKATEEELAQVKTALSEATAAVVELTEELKAPDSATADPTQASSASEQSSSKLGRRVSGSTEVENKSEATSPNRAGSAESSALHAVSFRGIFQIHQICVCTY